MIKHYFASANTGIGFVNNFKNIQNENDFTYVIKGGSGTGKSSLMKKIGLYFDKKGYDVLFFHCSTDAESLDGVKILGLGVCFVDGTAPHAQDVNMLGVDSKLLDVGQFVLSGVKKHKIEIENINHKKQILYKNLYLYLNSILNLQKIEQNNCEKIEKNIIFNEVDNILNDLKIKNNKTDAKVKEFFISSLQENGIINFVNENNFSKKIMLTHNFFICTKILEVLKQKLEELGCDLIVLRNNLNPELIEGVIICEKNIIILSNEWKGLTNDENIKNLLILAQKTLKEAKNLHKKLEEIYITHTNFKEIDKLTKKLIENINKKAKER